MSDACHVYPDLVRASCFEPALHECISVKTFQHFIMGDGVLAVFTVDAHLFPVIRMSSDRGVNCPFIVFETAEYHGIIFPCDRMNL